MAEYQVTIDAADVQELFQGDDGVKILVEKVLNQVLQAQASEQLQAGPYERTADRQGYRNGTRARKLTTRVGTLTLRIPQLREGQFSTDLFARYQRSEQALVLALMEMVVNGVSTRKITAITEELCGTEFSQSTVSALYQRLDPIVTAWNMRSLQGTRYPFLLVDALVLRIREDAQVKSWSGLIATGVNAAGYREILGLGLGDSESEATGTTFFQGLKDRGLHGVDWVISDDHRGLVNAVQRQFQGATWPRCQTHTMRNILDATPKAHRARFPADVRAIFEAPDPTKARTLWDAVVTEWADRAPQAVKVLESAFEAATAILVLPERYRQRLRTTNSQERLNEEIRRRERVIRIFPNRDSVIRLLGALLLEIHEKWTTGTRYLDMEEYAAWRAERAGTAQTGTVVAMR
jgi:putative transposase